MAPKSPLVTNGGGSKSRLMMNDDSLLGMFDDVYFLKASVMKIKLDTPYLSNYIFSSVYLSL